MAATVSTFTLASPDVSTRLAADLAPHLAGGDTILLDGPLGSGKTHFARGLIQARLAATGRSEDVPSPTFTLVQTYDDGVVEIWHTDLYRIGTGEEVLELGLDDAFETAICLVEWPDRLGDLQPKDALVLRFSHTDAPDTRDVSVTCPTDRWRRVIDSVLESAAHA